MQAIAAPDEKQPATAQQAEAADVESIGDEDTDTEAEDGGAAQAGVAGTSAETETEGNCDMAVEQEEDYEYVFTKDGQGEPQLVGIVGVDMPDADHVTDETHSEVRDPKMYIYEMEWDIGENTFEYGHVLSKVRFELPDGTTICSCSPDRLAALRAHTAMDTARCTMQCSPWRRAVQAGAVWRDSILHFWAAEGAQVPHRLPKSDQEQMGPQLYDFLHDMRDKAKISERAEDILTTEDHFDMREERADGCKQSIMASVSREPLQDTEDLRAKLKANDEERKRVAKDRRAEQRAAAAVRRIAPVADSDNTAAATQTALM